MNQYEVEGDSFLDHIITGDEVWYHHYEDKKEVILLDFLEPILIISYDHYITKFTKLKVHTSRVRPEKKTTFLLQNSE